MNETTNLTTAMEVTSLENKTMAGTGINGIMFTTVFKQCLVHDFNYVHNHFFIVYHDNGRDWYLVLVTNIKNIFLMFYVCHTYFGCVSESS